MHRFANPARFLRIARWATPLTLVLGLVLTTIGLTLGLFFSPPDYQQGESVRIMYVHVPAAWLASGGYLGLAVGWVEGIEVNFFGAVFGIDLRRPAVKLPGLGRVGFSV